MVAGLQGRPNKLEFGGMLSPNLLWRFSGLQIVAQSRYCAERYIGRGRSNNSVHDSHHRVSSRLLSLERD
jgi:hypothetical protein